MKNLPLEEVTLLQPPNNGTRCRAQGIRELRDERDERSGETGKREIRGQKSEVRGRTIEGTNY